MSRWAQISKQGPCPRCKMVSEMSYVIRADRARIRASRSFSCPDCGYREERDGHAVPEDVTELFYGRDFGRDGKYQLNLENFHGDERAAVGKRMMATRGWPGLVRICCVAILTLSVGCEIEQRIIVTPGPEPQFDLEARVGACQGWAEGKSTSIAVSRASDGQVMWETIGDKRSFSEPVTYGTARPGWRTAEAARPLEASVEYVVLFRGWGGYEAVDARFQF